MRPEPLPVTRSAEGRSHHRRRGLAALAGVLALVATACQAGWTQPYAGNGTAGAAGSGGYTTLAVAESFRTTGAVAAIPGGGFYVEDTGACVIRKVDALGGVTTVAGNGTCGTTGDNGPATDAEINFFVTNSMAVDGSGRLWFANESSGFGSHLRMVDANGTITSPAVGATGFAAAVTAAPDGTRTT